MPHCMVPSCTNGSRKTKGSNVSYHRLPNDQQMRRTWLRRIRRDNLPKATSCYICSAHFTSDCFETSLREMFGMQTKKSLKPGSVPSIFPFLYRKPERELSHKRKQILEKIARDEELASLLNTVEYEDITWNESEPASSSSKDAEV